MPDQVPGIDKTAALREALRRLDAVLAVARRVVAESSRVPPGLHEDFMEARTEVEKQFVRSFDVLDLDALQAFRNFLQATRGISAGKLEKNLDRLWRRVRSLANHLLIAESKGPGHESEVGGVRFNDHDPPHVKPAAPPEKQPSRRRLYIALSAVALVVLLSGGGVAVAWTTGMFSSLPPAPPRPIVRLDPQPETPQPETPEPEPARPVEPEDLGYTLELAVNVPESGIDPLAATTGSLVMDALPALLLGLEELVHEVEPARLHATPEKTREAWLAFAREVVAEAPQWRADRTPLLDAFASKLHLARYAPEVSAGAVLPSDVHYSAGGSQLPLIVTAQAMAQNCLMATLPIAPNGPHRPELSLRVRDRIETWNGESLGLRTSRQPVLEPRVALFELARLLRPTMNSARGRALADALRLRFGPGLTEGEALAALADIEPAWLLQPDEEAEPVVHQVRRIAQLLQPELCRLLVHEAAPGGVPEAIKLFRLARNAGDDEYAEAALLQLGERAEPGAMLDDVPLPYVIAEMLQQQGRTEDAIAWLRRAHEQHPDDPRAALILARHAEGAERFSLLRQAYARGAREADFVRMLAESAARQSEPLLALALLDELIASGNFEPADLETAALQCLALERTDWALTRLQSHAELVAAEASLQRLELICELSANGLTARAQDLAAAWRERGEEDAFVEGLLRRFGG